MQIHVLNLQPDKSNDQLMQIYIHPKVEIQPFTMDIHKRQIYI